MPISNVVRGLASTSRPKFQSSPATARNFIGKLFKLLDTKHHPLGTWTLDDVYHVESFLAPSLRNFNGSDALNKLQLWKRLGVELEVQKEPKNRWLKLGYDVVLQQWWFLAQKYPDSQFAMIQSLQVVSNLLENNYESVENALTPLLQHATTFYPRHADQVARSILLSPKLTYEVRQSLHPFYILTLTYVEDDQLRDQLVGIFEKQNWRIETLDEIQEEPVSEPDTDEKITLYGNETSTNDTRNAQSMSEFERKAIERRLLEKIGMAQDSTTVEDSIAEWDRLLSNGSSRQVLIEAVLSYYLNKARDPFQALQWWFQLEDNNDLLRDSALAIVTLWNESSKISSVEAFRVQDILQRLQQKQIDIPDEMYLAVALAWLSQSTPLAARKAQEVLRQSSKLSRNGWQCMVDAIAGDPNPAACEWLVQRLPMDLMDHALLEAICQVIGTCKASLSATELANNLYQKQKISLLTPLAAETLVKALPAEDIPQFIEQLHNDSTAMPKITLSMYNAMLGNVVDGLQTAPQKARIALAETILQNLWKDLENGQIGLHLESLALLIRYVVEAVATVQRENDCYNILKLAEESLSRISGKPDEIVALLSPCYKILLRVLVFKDRHSQVAAVFEHVKKHAIEKLDRKFYEFYLKSLSKQGPQTLGQQEELLCGLIERYQSSGDAELQPTERIFRVVLTSCHDDATFDNACRADALLQQMISLGISVKDPYGFTIVMQTYSKSQSNRSFSRIKALFQQCQTLVEPDFHLLVVALKGCELAKQTESSEALPLMLDVFRRIRDMGKVDYRIYKSVFLILIQLNVRRDTVVVPLFRLCCEDGLLSKSIITKAQRLISADAWTQVYNKRLVDGREPPEWSSNLSGNIKV